ncbi:MAG: hypothetical protein ACFCVA_06035 [Gammaproteobacteria bacterium]
MVECTFFFMQHPDGLFRADEETTLVTWPTSDTELFAALVIVLVAPSSSSGGATAALASRGAVALGFGD